MQLSDLFSSDPRIELEPDLDPRPSPRRWPTSAADLAAFAKRLNPDDPRRLPKRWPRLVRSLKTDPAVRMLRVHRGFFLSMGVHDWSRFYELMILLARQPDLVRRVMRIQGEFSAALTQIVLQDAEIDAAVFSEPIGGNDRPLMSPDMYEDIVLESYEPILQVLRRYGVETIIFRTYANARILIPRILGHGFNCLWACEVNIEAMDYRSLRREFGKDLRLIGGIDLDVLRFGKEQIRREISEKVPPLLEEGGYIPLADGRVREDVPYENYLYYRQLLMALSRQSPGINA